MTVSIYAARTDRGCAAAPLLACGRQRRGRARHRPQRVADEVCHITSMLRNAFPALGNQFISLFKDTRSRRHRWCHELTCCEQDQRGNTFRVIEEPWLVATPLYVARLVHPRRRMR